MPTEFTSTALIHYEKSYALVVVIISLFNLGSTTEIAATSKETYCAIIRPRIEEILELSTTDETARMEHTVEVIHFDRWCQSIDRSLRLICQAGKKIG